MSTRTSDELTLADRLSHLTHAQVCRLLGPRAKELLRAGGAREIKPAEQARLEPDRFSLVLPDAQVTIALADEARLRLGLRCSACTAPCEHVAAALSLILEEKMLLGLAVPPPESVPVESLGEQELVERALDERRERARTERMTVRSSDPGQPWTDYRVTSAASGRSYRVALRGRERGQSYCSCPDFRKNTLGTCKHILCALRRVGRRFPAARLRKPYRRPSFSLYLRYDDDATLRLGRPARKLERAVETTVAPLRDRAIEDLPDLLQRLRRLERLGEEVTLYPDAEEFIEQGLFRERIRQDMGKIRADPVGHPLRRELLRAELLPYQLDGIAFAVAAGRAVLADDMGLGKTIQAIGTAELLRREAGIERVLVVCPATLKSQWRSEIERFSELDCQLVLGSAQERVAQYRSRCFFTVCNYEQVLRDLLTIETVPWDLIVLDEAQRIKNWEAKTSGVIKALRSRFALALTGTPLENRLDELYSVVEFIDDRRLGPAFRFFNRHRTANAKGRVLGYENLGELRDALAPILLRRTRETVMDELPPRSTEIVRVTPTEEQLELHNAHMQTVIRIARKKYISEMDLLRLRRALQAARMAADATALVDKQRPGYSSKLERLDELLEQLVREEGRKIVIFSEWTTMLDLIEGLLEARGLGWVRLDGSVPQKKRQVLVDSFARDPDCRLFLATNAGSLGLNLQAANTVVNVDLPWNPAVLEQRISRAHRMGQRRPVQVFVLISEETIEEKLLVTLSAKADLALAVLDPDSDVEAVDMVSGLEELRRRLEVLIGAKPEAPLDESGRRERAGEVERLGHRERVAAAAGKLVGAAFSLLGELLPAGEPTPQATHLADQFRKQLEGCIEEDEAGRPALTVRLPDRAALDDLANSLGRLLAEQERLGAAGRAPAPPAQA